MKHHKKNLPPSILIHKVFGTIFGYLVLLILFPVLILTFHSCSQNNTQTMIEKKNFGKLPDGREVLQYSLKNKSGMGVNVITYGAIVTNIFVKDKNGNIGDIVLGYDSLEGYLNDKSYFGAIVGRYGNRIGKGKFSLDGKGYQLTINDGENHLHGGKVGFDKVLWNAESKLSPSGPSLTLTYVSKDGEEGYPGTVTLSVTYTVTDSNELEIQYTGKTDKPTILNPTHHSYFNLTGDLTKPILDHQLMINANQTTPVVKGLITTGELAEVASTPMDFRTLTPIGLHINDTNEQLTLAGGYDHNWVLNNYNGKVRQVVELYEPMSGRLMTVSSDQPGMQFYSGNFLNGSAIGKKGIAYQFRTGLCLEAQAFPDTPNKTQWPSVVLRPGETYKQTTIYKFSTK